MSDAPEPSDKGDRLVRLARRFPSIRASQPQGLEPWDPEVFDGWACTQPTDSARRYVAQFVLEQWHPGRAWAVGRFDPVAAAQCWDEAHREVFLEWLFAVSDF